MATLEPLSEVLTESVEQVKQREASALDLLLEQRQGRCVLYGAGTLGRRAAKLLRESGTTPLAMVDSNPDRWGSRAEGLQVLSPRTAAERFGSDAVFFVTIWNDFHWFHDTCRKLTGAGCTLVSSYAPIFWSFGDRFMELRLLNEPPHRLYQDKSHVLDAEAIWADEESSATYRANIIWRALGDPSQLPYPAPVNTYFPQDVFRVLSNEVVVDCGAFDGDTLRMLLACTQEFQSFHAIEADAVSLGKLRSCVEALPLEVKKNVRLHDCAVGAERCKLHFAMSGALTAKLDDVGVEVDCIPLDELFADTPVSLIKMDIEGAEYDALRGAENIIRRDRPVLAICVYHTQADIWRIPLWVRSLDADYSFYLRSYDGDGFQTVMYAVPQGRMLTPAERASATVARKPVQA